MRFSDHLTFLPKKNSNSKLIAGFNSEFIEREDGFKGLDSLYNLPMEIKEMEIGLMYRALYEGNIDVIDGFSTDGRIKEFNLKSLVDDKSYFPPYYASAIVNGELLKTNPEVQEALDLLSGSLTDERMAELNYQVDGLKKPLEQVANEFLKELNIYTNPYAGQNDQADLIIGSKAFTESFLLAHIFAQLIENKTNLTTKLELGFGGTKLIFDALRIGEIDIYPEYTGTAYLVLLQKSPEMVSDFTSPQVIYKDVKQEFLDRYNLHWMPPLGFNNTFALMMRTKHADSLQILNISELSDYLNGR